MKYVIGTGFFNKKGELLDELHRIWFRNTLRYTTPAAIYVIGHAGSIPPEETCERGKWITVTGDLGNIGMLLDGSKPYMYTGWTMCVITLALLAYQDEADFIFKEQDCFAFGNWPQRMYKELGTHNVIFGNYKEMGCAQSLFLVKRDYIPIFVELMLHNGDERRKENLGELKFVRFEKQYPDDFCRFSFGYDRTRPFDIKDDVFYVQQLTGEELNSLINAGLLDGRRVPNDFWLCRHKAMY